MKKLLLAITIAFACSANAQSVAINNDGSTANNSAILDLKSTNQGFLPPRVSKIQMNTIATPAEGLTVYCTDCTPKGLTYFDGATWVPAAGSNTPLMTVSCGGTNGFKGVYCNSLLSGATYDVTVTNNDFIDRTLKFTFSDLVLSGIAGVSVSSVSPTAIIKAGQSAVISYTLSGTPAALGTLTGTFTKQGLTCSSAVAIVTGQQTVSAASSTPTLCNNTPLTPITHSTTNANGIGIASGLPAGITASFANNTITISGTPNSAAVGTFNYTVPLTGCGTTVNATGTIIVNGVGTYFSSQTNFVNVALSITHATNNGVAGIGSATGLPPGVTATWANNIITISGTPTSTGTFTYNIPLTGSSLCLSNATGIITVGNCMAVIGGVYKVFMCHNLGATNTALDPNLPVQAINGSYYQWGKLAPVATASTSAAAISGWSTTMAVASSWDVIKVVGKDPCPTGFKVPSDVQLASLIADNVVTRTGSWLVSTTNFDTAIHFGTTDNITLTLPAAGYRAASNGLLVNRSSLGQYWTSAANTKVSTGTTIEFTQNSLLSKSFSGTSGLSVRCISE